MEQSGSAVRGNLGKRKKEAIVSSKKKAAKVPITMLSPPKKAKVVAKASPSGAITPAVRKFLTVKGSTIRFEDTEAKVAAVEGKYIRVHYKGESADNDEWLPINSKELRRRIVAVDPPAPKSKESTN